MERYVLCVYYQLITTLIEYTGLEIKKKNCSGLLAAITDKDKQLIIISKFKLPEVIGTPNAGKQIQKLPLTLTVRQFTQE